MVKLTRKAQQRFVLQRLKQAVKQLESCPEFALLIPEVRTNIVFALPDAQTPEEVAGVDGRITVVRNMPKAAGPIRFGASDHLARLVLELRRFDPAIRSALNFRWNEQIYSFVRKLAGQKKKSIGSIDRSKEPAEIIGRDKMSVPWKVKELISSTGGKVPNIAYETRGWGKEPLFLLIGKDPLSLAKQVIEIARGYGRRIKRQANR